MYLNLKNIPTNLLINQIRQIERKVFNMKYLSEKLDNKSKMEKKHKNGNRKEI